MGVQDPSLKATSFLPHPQPSHTRLSHSGFSPILRPFSQPPTLVFRNFPPTVFPLFFPMFVSFYITHKTVLVENSHKIVREYTTSKNVLGFCYIQFSKDALKSMAKCRHYAIFHYLGKTFLITLSPSQY